MNNDINSMPTELPSEHLSESLSALVDGELNTTESAFLIKRMAHDAELNTQWRRFQGIGEVLRGHAQILDSDSFSARVLSKIADAQADSANAAQKAAIQQAAAATAATSDRMNRHKLNRITLNRLGRNSDSRCGCLGGLTVTAENSNRISSATGSTNGSTTDIGEPGSQHANGIRAHRR